MDRDGATGDMARIQRGLEEFLQKELEGMQPEPQFYDLREEADDTEEMQVELEKIER